MVKECIATV